METNVTTTTAAAGVFSPTVFCDGFRSDRERRALYRHREEKEQTPDTVVFVQISRDQLVTFGLDAFLVAYCYGWTTEIVTYDLVGPVEQKVDAAWVRALYAYPITSLLEAGDHAWRIVPLVGEGTDGQQ